jgi:hypothetical protein
MKPSQWPDVICNLTYFSYLAYKVKLLGSILISQFPFIVGNNLIVVEFSHLLAIFHITYLELPILINPKLTNGSNSNFPASGITWIGTSHSYPLYDIIVK